MLWPRRVVIFTVVSVTWSDRIVVICVAAVLAGCAHAGGDSEQAVIEISSGGGLAPSVMRVSDTLPRVWISGYGHYLRRPATGVESPAMPVLEERRLSEAAVLRLLEDARGAGLLAESPDYGTPRIYDAMNTRIVVVADGTRHEVLVQALGYPVVDLDAATTAARQRVSQFVDDAEHPGRLPGAGAAQTYTPTQAAVFVLGPAAPGTTAVPASWPLGDLATIGAAVQSPAPGARCVVVAGSDLRAVAAAADGVAAFAPWQSGKSLWDIAIRPLLPDEHSCADVGG